MFKKDYFKYLISDILKMLIIFFTGWICININDFIKRKITFDRIIPLVVLFFVICLIEYIIERKLIINLYKSLISSKYKILSKIISFFVVYGFMFFLYFLKVR